LFQQCGIDVHEVQQNISVKRNGEGLEIDLLVVNDKDTIAIECKSNLSIDDVNEHLERLAKIALVPKLQLGNQDSEAPASRNRKLELPRPHSQTGVWE